jgi:HK97 gp10 family phage protein
MAKFSTGGSLDDMITTLNQLSLTDEMAQECIREGENIMMNEIQKGANKHIKTGSMAASLIKTTPILSNESWIGRIKFVGSAGVHVSKTGAKYDITNWLKAFRIEYGTSKEKAHPFVRPAVRRSKKQISKKWQEIYDRELKKKI